MNLYDYIDGPKLYERVLTGMVEVRYHPTLPLRIYTHSRRCAQENAWDEVTTKCRGLIVDSRYNTIVSRPFEKFFNINTSWLPETMVENLPKTQPVVAEKLDGSLGILYRCYGEVGIATKGSFTSDQAKWATEFYRKNYNGTIWPEDYTPIFEIIAESVQHHVVHYNGIERLVLIALIHNETGEELDSWSLLQWARHNNVELSEFHVKSVADVLAEDRPNTEGYVLSWTRPGRPPLKIKVKHPGFLDLQKIVHAATPKAILEALTAGNTELVQTWMFQTDGPLSTWVQGWVQRLNQEYGELLFKANGVVNRGYQAVMNDDSGFADYKAKRRIFAEYIRKNGKGLEPICFAMLDEKDHKPIVWKLVKQKFEGELGKDYSLQDEEND